MRAFAEAYPDEQFAQQVVGQIPWGHNVRLLDKVSDPLTREWYARKTIEHGWSRAILEAQIETKLHLRQGATTNFSRCTQNLRRHPNLGFHLEPPNSTFVIWLACPP